MVSALFTAVYAVWALGVVAVVPDLRTRRYVGFAALLVAAWAACGWLPGTAAVVARNACSGVLCAGIVLADRLGLASLTPAGLAVRARVDEALRLGRGKGSRTPVPEAAERQWRARSRSGQFRIGWKSPSRWL